MARIWAGLAAAGLFLLAVLGIYSKGRSDASAGAAKQRLEEDVERQREILDQVNEAHQVRQDVEQEIRLTPEQERRKRLAEKWGDQ